MAAVFEQGFNALLRAFHMELQCDNAFVIDKALIDAWFAGGELNGAVRDIERVAMPVENSEGFRNQIGRCISAPDRKTKPISFWGPG